MDRTCYTKSTIFTVHCPHYCGLVNIVRTVMQIAHMNMYRHPGRDHEKFEF